MKRNFKRAIGFALAAFISATTIFAYELPQEGEYDQIALNCVDDAMVSVTADEEKTLSNVSSTYVSKMGNGSTSLNTYQIVDMSDLEDNVTASKYAFLKFDISKIQEKKVYDAVLNINMKIQGSHNGTLYLYGADGLNLDEDTDLANQYANWDSLLEKIDSKFIGKFKRPAYNTNTTGSWIQIDISTYIRHRARLGYSDATIMFKYKPETMNAVYWMAISDRTTAYAPYITANVPKVETVETKLKSASSANIKSGLTTGDISSVANISPSNMSNGSNVSSYTLSTVADDAQADPKRLFLTYDLSNYLYDDIQAVSLDFLAKFVGNNAGVLNLYSADGLTKSASEYSNISEINASANKKLIASLNRAYKTYTTGTPLSLDVTSYIKEAAALKKSNVTMMMEFVPSSNNTTYVLYIARDTTEFGPSLKFTVNSNPNKDISFNENTKKLSMNLKSYYGSKENPVTVRPFLAVFSGSMLKSIGKGSDAVLDGNGALLSADVTADIDSNDEIKFFVWDSKSQPYYLEKNSEYFDDVEGVFPYKIYTATNDSENSDRNYTLSTYADYLYNEDSGILFGTENNLSDHFTYPIVTMSEQGDNTTIRKSVELPLFSDKYFIGKKTVRQVNTVMSKKSDSPIRLLCLGDSVTAGAGTTTKYWEYLQELFWKESIDFNDPSRKIMTLGTNFKGTSNSRVGGNDKTLTYQGVTETLHSHGEGRGGWKISNFLYHDKYYDNNAESYAAMGGNADEWTASWAQKDYINSHTMVTPSATEQPDNVFYDADKEGEIKFSIKKWLERYRTHDENGQKLELGDERLGTYITASNINKYEVCEPTHILIQFGHNDFRYHTEELFRTNLWLLIDEIRKDLPDVTIIISQTPPSLGTYNQQLYPTIPCIKPAGEAWFRNAIYLNDYFENYDEKANKIYLLPTYFVTQTAEVYDNSASNVLMPELHPNEIGHFQWGYQLYSLLKYIQ